MSFANPWGLLGLLSLPAILFFHWYQRRFPRMAVAGLHLWGVTIDSRDAGPKRERLPITASLLLELLLALLITLILSRPRIDSTEKSHHLVIVLDDSASMSAAPIGETSPRDAAIQLIEQRIAALPPNSVVTVLLTGTEPKPIVGPEARPDEVVAGVANWQPDKPLHRFEPAWDQAAQIAGESGQVLFITDHIPVTKKRDNADAVLIRPKADGNRCRRSRVRECRLHAGAVAARSGLRPGPQTDCRRYRPRVSLGAEFQRLSQVRKNHGSK